MRSSMRIKLPRDVADLIRTLHPQIKRKVRSALEAIQVDPTSGKQLRGELSGYRNFRVGRIRIIYREKDETIDIVAVGPREIVYLDTALLIKKSPREI